MKKKSTQIHKKSKQSKVNHRHLSPHYPTCSPLQPLPAYRTLHRAPLKGPIKFILFRNMFVFFGSRSVFYINIMPPHAKPCRIRWKSNEKISLGSETCEIGGKVLIWTCPDLPRPVQEVQEEVVVGDSLWII